MYVVMPLNEGGKRKENYLLHSEMSRNISRETSVMSDISYTDRKCARTVERWITTVKYHGISHTMLMEK